MKQEPDYVLPELKDIGGEPCNGVTFGKIYGMVGYGAELLKATIKAGGWIPTHGRTDKNTNVVYIIKGNGRLGLVDHSTKESKEVSYKEGDAIIFRPNTDHYWNGGSADSELLVIQFNN